MASASLARSVIKWRRDVAEGRLALALDDLAPPPTLVSILYQANRQRSPNVRAFVAAARRHFNEQPIV